MKQTQSSMDPQIREEFGHLLRIFSDVFSKSEWDIGKCDFVQHRIDLYPGSKLVKLPNHRMPLFFKKYLRRKVDIFLEHKYITLCHRRYSSPVMLVPRKKGKLKLVINYGQLNKEKVKGCSDCLLLKKCLTIWKEIVSSQSSTCHGVSTGSL